MDALQKGDHGRQIGNTLSTGGTMTRKHYVALAKALASTRPDAEDYATEDGYSTARWQWLADRETLMGYLATTNPLFDRARFVAATEA